MALFPAHAGMIPPSRFFSNEVKSVPRTRGDDPIRVNV